MVVMIDPPSRITVTATTPPGPVRIGLRLRRNGSSWASRGRVSSRIRLGMPVILDGASKAGQAYADVVGRYLGETIEHRFVRPERRGLFQRLLWRTA